MTVDDCSKGRFRGVRIPPEAAPLAEELAGVDATVVEGAIGVVIAPRPRAGVIAATAGFCFGVASTFVPPESRAERLVVRAPDTAFSASLGSSAAAVAVEAGEQDLGRVGIRRNR